MTRLTFVMVLLSVKAQSCMGLETGLRGEPKRKSAHLAGAANAAPDHIKETPKFAHIESSDATASAQGGPLEPRMTPLPVAAQPSPPEGLMPPPVANAVVLAAKPADKAAEAKAVHMAAIQIEQAPAGIIPGALNSRASECRCQFHGLCSCEQALEFMSCMADACASGQCECEPGEFENACTFATSSCPKSGLTCNATAASCPHAVVPKGEPAMEIVGDLKEMR